jgi:hypothetical protein
MNVQIDSLTPPAKRLKLSDESNHIKKYSTTDRYNRLVEFIHLGIDEHHHLNKRIDFETIVQGCIYFKSTIIQNGEDNIINNFQLFNQLQQLEKLTHKRAQKRQIRILKNFVSIHTPSALLQLPSDLHCHITDYLAPEQKVWLNLKTTFKGRPTVLCYWIEHSRASFERIGVIPRADRSLNFSSASFASQLIARSC